MQALEGLRVVDMATLIAGPGAARYLADFGADVIKVEPPGGEGIRRLGWIDDRDGQGLMHKLVNRGKRSLVLDLKQAADLDTMRRLLADADVLVENFRPGTLERLGLAPADLLERNPGLVILRVSGFGQDGPYASRPGFATLAEAMGGFAAINGEPDGPPLLPPIALTDEIAALVGAFTVMVALRHRERTGEGQVIDVNLLESMLQVLGPLPSAYAHGGYLQPRLGAGIPYTVPRSTYRCADGVWVAISTSSETVADRVLGLIGVGDDERFGSFDRRADHREELDDLLAAWIAARPSAEVLGAFEAAQAAIAPVYTMADVFTDPHVQARGVVIDVGGTMMQNVVARLSRTPGAIRHAGRMLDADRHEILAGVDAENGS